MPLRALPLIILPLILYNVLATFSGGAAEEFFRSQLFTEHAIKGARWSFTFGDLIILVTLVVLFAEIVKATYTSTVSLLDHGLSMLVFLACLIEFLVVGAAATSVFFFIMLTALIDVVVGFTIGIRVARRDLTIGAEH